MNTLTQFLVEQHDVEQYAQKIAQDCKPYLHLRTYEHTPLHRRIKNTTDNFVYKQVRKDRKPTDTEPLYHQMLDNWFYKQFGHRFRSNAMFAQGDPYIIVEGTHFWVFPIGDFTFCWSTQISDLFEQHGGILDDIFDATGYTRDQWFDALNSVNTAQQLPSHIKKATDEVMKQYDYKTTSWNQALQSGHEIMIACDAYYGVRSSPDQVDAYHKLAGHINQALEQ